MFISFLPVTPQNFILFWLNLKLILKFVKKEVNKKES